MRRLGRVLATAVSFLASVFVFFFPFSSFSSFSFLLFFLSLLSLLSFLSSFLSFLSSFLSFSWFLPFLSFLSSSTLGFFDVLGVDLTGEGNAFLLVGVCGVFVPAQRDSFQ